MSRLDKMSKSEAHALKEIDAEVKHLESLKDYPPHPTMVVKDVMDFIETPYRSKTAKRHGAKLLARALDCLNYAVYCYIKPVMKTAKINGRYE